MSKSVTRAPHIGHEIVAKHFSQQSVMYEIAQHVRAVIGAGAACKQTGVHSVVARTELRLSHITRYYGSIFRTHTHRWVA